MANQNNIVFVVGALRSGTTLLRIMLNANSSINAPGEFNFAFDAIAPEGGLEGASKLDPLVFVRHLQSDRIFLDLKIPAPGTGSIAERILMMTNSLFVSDKLLVLFIHRNFLSAHEVFPGAKYIHMVRDPRDSAQSAIDMGWSGNVYYGTDFWLEAEQSWERLKPLLHKRKYVELKYEDVIAYPERSMLRVCSFLGVEYHPKMITLEGSTYHPLDPKHSELWKRKLSPRKISLIESRTILHMMRNGYVPMHKTPREPSRIEWLALNFQNRIYKHFFRLTRYGLALWLREIATRRLDLSDMHAKTLTKIMEIDRRYLK